VAKERRNLFKSFFGLNDDGRRVQQSANSTQFRLLNDYVPIFYNFSGDIWDSDIVRSAVHTIASNVAKLKVSHVRVDGNNVMPTNSTLDYMLQNRPNQYETTYDFLYKITTQLLIHNNAFVYCRYNNLGQLVGLYNIQYQYMELLDVSGEMYCKFTFRNAQVITLPYVDMIHIRRYFQDSDFFGSNNNKALDSLLKVIQTVNDGIVNSIKSSANLRGIIKYTQSMLKPEDLQKEKDRFINDYLNINNNGGIAALDSKADFVPLELKTTLIDDKTIHIIRDAVYHYYGVNEALVTSNFTESQYQAFYENVIQPIAIQLSQEFTEKLFTEREKGFGNKVVFQANHFSYMSTASKISMIQQLIPVGLLTLNEAREIFNLPNVEDGDKRLMSLNYVDIDKAEEYQLGITNKNTLTDVKDDKNSIESEVEDDNGEDQEGNKVSGTEN